MAAYHSGSTVTNTSSAQNIVTGASKGDLYELQSNGQAFWFSVAGTASVAGANCVYVPPGGGVEIRIHESSTSISIIKDTGVADEGVSAFKVTP